MILPVKKNIQCHWITRLLTLSTILDPTIWGYFIFQSISKSFTKKTKEKVVDSKCFIDSDTISTYPYTYSNQITCDCTSYIHLQRVLVCSANGLQKESLWSKWIHSKGGKYYLVFPEHNECILPSLTWIVDLTMNLISVTHNLCEMIKYTFIVLRKY